MAGDEDARACSYRCLHVRDLRFPVCRSVCLVQQGKNLHTVFPAFQHECNHVGNFKILEHGGKRFLDEARYGRISLSQHRCMGVIRPDPFEAIEKR